MKSKKASPHPLLIILAVALVSVLFAVSCGGGATSTAVPQAGATQADEAAEAAAAEAAAAEAAAAEAAALVDEAAAAEAEAAAGEAAAVEAAELAKYGGTLTMAIVADHSTLDPAFSVTQIEGNIIRHVYDPLLFIEHDLSMSPGLATSWEANDDLSSFTFHLRKGVKFHHGKEFKAEDVVFSLTRHMDPELETNGFAQYKVVDQIVAVDDYTVRIDLKGPNGVFIDSLFRNRYSILPSDLSINQLALQPSGTGPFILDEWLVGERATMVRNPDYWDEGLPYLDELVLVGIEEAATRASALTAGDVDVVWRLEPQSIPALEAHPDTMVLSVATSGNIGVAFDNRKPPFDNKLVRQAMQAATNRQLINQAALLGLGKVAYDHSINPTDPRFATEYAPLDFDIELAKSLLEQAGYPDGIDVPIHTGDVGPGMIEMVVALKESMAPAGIRIDIQRHPADAFWSDVWMVEDNVVFYWSGLAPNPDQLLTYMYHVDSPWNAWHYDNDTINGLIERARAETLEQQKVTYGELQRIIIDDAPGLVIAFRPELFGVRANVRDVDPHPLVYRSFKNSWIEK